MELEELHLGVKLIKAKPSTHGEYSKEKYGESNPINTTSFSKESKDSEGYKVIYEDGYVSWSPKAVFEKAYRRIDGLTFGLAIEAAKMGKKIFRSGWNGLGMFVVYQKGYPQGIPANKQTAEAWNMNEGDSFICNPYLQIKCANRSHSMWVPSINDVLAEDWSILKD